MRITNLFTFMSYKKDNIYLFNNKKDSTEIDSNYFGTNSITPFTCMGQVFDTRERFYHFFLEWGNIEKQAEILAQRSKDIKPMYGKGKKADWVYKNYNNLNVMYLSILYATVDGKNEFSNKLKRTNGKHLVELDEWSFKNSNIFAVKKSGDDYIGVNAHGKMLEYVRDALLREGDNYEAWKEKQIASVLKELELYLKFEPAVAIA